jgi:hypothetical protein
VVQHSGTSVMSDAVKLADGCPGIPHIPLVAAPCVTSMLNNMLCRMQGPIIGRLSLPAATASQAVVLAFDAGLVANTDYLLKLIAVDAYGNCQVNSIIDALPGVCVCVYLAASQLVLRVCYLLAVVDGVHSVVTHCSFNASCCTYTAGGIHGSAGPHSGQCPSRHAGPGCYKRYWQLWPAAVDTK